MSRAPASPQATSTSLLLQIASVLFSRPQKSGIMAAVFLTSTYSGSGQRVESAEEITLDPTSFRVAQGDHRYRRLVVLFLLDIHNFDG